MKKIKNMKASEAKEIANKAHGGTRPKRIENLMVTIENYAKQGRYQALFIGDEMLPDLIEEIQSMGYTVVRQKNNHGEFYTYVIWE
jgi:hypothetical protein